MRQLNNKGFLLIDALINVLIVSSLCLLCFVSYQAVLNYKEGFEVYLNESNERYEDLFNQIGECERCVIEETVSSN